MYRRNPTNYRRYSTMLLLVLLCSLMILTNSYQGRAVAGQTPDPTPTATLGNEDATDLLAEPEPEPEPELDDAEVAEQAPPTTFCRTPQTASDTETLDAMRAVQIDMAANVGMQVAEVDDADYCLIEDPFAGMALEDIPDDPAEPSLPDETADNFCLIPEPLNGVIDDNAVRIANAARQESGLDFCMLPEPLPDTALAEVTEEDFDPAPVSQTMTDTIQAVVTALNTMPDLAVPPEGALLVQRLAAPKPAPTPQADNQTTLYLPVVQQSDSRSPAATSPTPRPAQVALQMVSLGADHRQGLPGSTVDFAIRLINLGPDPATIDLRLDDTVTCGSTIPGCVAAFTGNPIGITLSPDQSYDLGVSMLLPASAPLGNEGIAFIIASARAPVNAYTTIVLRTSLPPPTPTATHTRTPTRTSVAMPRSPKISRARGLSSSAIRTLGMVSPYAGTLISP